MIVLYTGDEAASLLDKAVNAASGETYHIKPGSRLPETIDDISRWIAQTNGARCIVLYAASASDQTELDTYNALRRMAKFSGVDVHMAGDNSVQDVADRVVTSDDELELLAPGSDVGAKIADLSQSEKMTQFERVEMDIPTVEEILATTQLTEDEAQEKIAWLKQQAVWANNLYQVNIEYMPEDRAHLIVRRLDKQAIHSWQHFQEIKNQLLGPECEAVECYPKESQLVDEKHHYHLWGFRSPERSFGIGFRVGRQTR